MECANVDLCECVSDNLAGRFCLAGRVVPSGSARAARASGAVIFEFAPLTPLHLGPLLPGHRLQRFLEKVQTRDGGVAQMTLAA